jgi:COPII coat assembly protein SEC16
MNTVESAASLFGSDDAGPDPFAVLGDSVDTPAPSSTSDVHGGKMPTFEEPSTDAAAANLFGSEASSSTQHTSTLHDPYTYDASTYSQHPSIGASYSNDQHAQGWYDGHGQWHTQQYLPANPAETGEHFVDQFSPCI